MHGNMERFEQPLIPIAEVPSAAESLRTIPYAGQCDPPDSIHRTAERLQHSVSTPGLGIDDGDDSSAQTDSRSSRRLSFGGADTSTCRAETALKSPPKAGASELEHPEE